MTSRSAGSAALAGAHPEILRQRLARARACGSRPTPRPRPPRAAPTRPPARCRPRRARARACRGGEDRAERRDQARRVGVLGRGSRRRRANVSVFAAPISRAAALASLGSSSAACLCGIVTFAPWKPAAPSARVVSLEQRRRHRQALVVPVAQAERRERRVVHRRGAAVRDRPAEDAQASHHFSSCTSAACPPFLLDRRLVGGDVRFERRLGVGEHLLAAAVRRRPRSRGRRRARGTPRRGSMRRRGWRSASAAGPCACACCTASRSCSCASVSSCV